jgi:mRNA-degrading endonuclease YafQ of YafQ-DinJ toxin-antitoxin module
MKKIVISPKFRRALRRYSRRHPEQKKRIESVIQQIGVDVFAPSLGTHFFKEKLENFQGRSCGYDCRIAFSVEPGQIVLFNIRTHDQI